VPTPNSVFRALADPTRRRILRLLRNGPRSSGDIATHFQTAWPTISRHLSVLREADLILAERNGNSIRYELNTTVFHDVVDGLLDLVQPGGRDA
jgi:DNA-binding transcriptional ArsR family regulator